MTQSFYFANIPVRLWTFAKFHELGKCMFFCLPTQNSSQKTHSGAQATTFFDSSVAGPVFLTVGEIYPGRTLRASRGVGYIQTI